MGSHTIVRRAYPRPNREVLCFRVRVLAGPKATRKNHGTNTDSRGLGDIMPFSSECSGAVASRTRDLNQRMDRRCARRRSRNQHDFAWRPIDGKMWLMCAKPRHDPRIGRRFRRLAENVGVDKVSHSVSVDPDSIGTKKPFSGQPRSQSSAPSLGAGERRLSRYSPRPRRSTSNACPASIRSCRRNSAGRTIWPFEETVVFISCKISSYTITSSRLLSPPRRGLRSAISFLSTRDLVVVADPFSLWEEGGAERRMRGPDPGRVG